MRKTRFKFDAYNIKRKPLGSVTYRRKVFGQIDATGQRRRYTVTFDYVDFQLLAERAVTQNISFSEIVRRLCRKALDEGEEK